MPTFAELMHAASNDASGDRCCLITKQSLDYSCVRLQCGHEFNYEGLLNNMIYCKQDHNATKSNAIRCPYCRTLTPHMLPHCLSPDGTMMAVRAGINSPQTRALPQYRCTWVQPSGPNCGVRCCAPGVLHPNGVHCKKHISALARLEKKREQQKLNHRAKEQKECAKRHDKLTKASEAVIAKCRALQEKLDALSLEIFSQDTTASSLVSAPCVYTKKHARRVASLSRLVAQMHERSEALKKEWDAFHEEWQGICETSVAE